MRKIVHLIIRAITWLLLSVVVLLLVVFFIIQTPAAKNKLARIAELQANNYLNAKLSIGKLEGNLFSDITLSGLSLTDNNDTLLAIDALHIEYNLWPLWEQQLQINSIRIENPQLYLLQLPDSTWNLMHLLKETAHKSDNSAAHASPNLWIIKLEQLILARGSIRIQSPDTLIPKKIEALNIVLSANYSDAAQQLQLDSLSFSTFKPDFEVKHLAFNLNRNATISQISGLTLVTHLNLLTAEAIYDENRAGTSTLSLKTAPLHLEEFSLLLPDINLAIQPEISLNAQLRGDSLTTELDLQHQEQTIKLKVQSGNFMKWALQPDFVALVYSANLVLDKVKLDEWSGQKAYNYLLNGKFDGSGSGTEPKTMQAKLKGVLSNSNIAGYRLNKLQTEADYHAGNLTANAALTAAFAQLTASGNLSQLFGKPAYSVKLQLNQFNLAPLVDDDSLQTNINLKAEIDGRGFEQKTAFARFKLDVAHSQVMHIEVDTAFAAGHFSNQTLRIDSLYLNNSSLSVQASGEYQLIGSSDIRLFAELKSVDAFRPLLPNAEINTHGIIEAQLSGPVDSLHITSSAQFDESRYDDYQLKTINMKAEGELLPDGMQMQAYLSGEHFTSPLLNLDSIRIGTVVFNDSLRLKALIGNSELSSMLQSSLSWNDLLRLRVENWEFQDKNQSWKLASPAVFEMDSTNYRLNGLLLKTEDGQSISAGGTFSQTGNENFKLEIEGLKIEKILQALDIDAGISGQLNLNLNLAGTASAPAFNGSFKLDSAEVASYKLAKAEGKLEYESGLLNLDSELKLQEQGQFLATGRIPFGLNFENFASTFSPDDKVDVQVKIKELPLNLLGTLLPAKEIGGVLNGEVVIDGSMNAPNPKGFVRLDNGKINIPEYGIDYRNMQFKTSFDNKLITLDSLRINSSDGYISGTGRIDFASEFYKGEITNSDLNIKFNKFNPIDLKQVNMQVNGDINLQGTQNAVVFGGNLVIPQSEIDLTTAMNMFGEVYTPDLPPSILMQELEKQQQANDSIRFSEKATAKNTNQTTSSYFDNLTGKLNIHIPRNTWIKDPNLRIEISGDLQILKNTKFAEIFGNVTVIRGQYELFGRTFIVSEGEISFQGGEEINPTIDLTATYTIKSQTGSSQTLTITVGGEALSPSLSFTLDDESISEGDALSYIVFGKPLNELSSSQQSDVSATSTESLAKSAAASLLASQLTKLLGDNLNVDYIEVKSQSDFDNASLELGKYLTNKLFVSYEQQFGSTTDDDVSRYEVKLEYQILRFLFLQLNNSATDSGFDLLFKIKAK